MVGSNHSNYELFVIGWITVPRIWGCTWRVCCEFIAILQWNIWLELKNSAFRLIFSFISLIQNDDGDDFGSVFVHFFFKTKSISVSPSPQASNPVVFNDLTEIWQLEFQEIKQNSTQTTQLLIQKAHHQDVADMAIPAVFSGSTTLRHRGNLRRTFSLLPAIRIWQLKSVFQSVFLSGTLW